LLEGEKEIRIYGETHKVRAEVVSIQGFSAHADQAFLTTYARSALPRVRKVILVHGESGPATAFQAILKRSGFDDVLYPALGDSLEL
jgi:metallo-beta-lactamase family protein